ncbi:MAG: single-stranded-DNA-specific exonuclease RecJ, partial [Eggerthellaceae bacterium]|nr:single-stranded-DNA-specific exonuclease RecJ [Eggerthellaceae bacterium]
ELTVEEFRGKLYIKFMLQDILPCQEPAVLLEESEDTQAPSQETAEDARGFWKAKAAQDSDSLIEAITAAIIGEHQPHASQLAILDNLKRGINTLGVMATDRCKSFIFHVFACYLALAKGQASLFVYPLRSLIADQLFHLNSQVSKFGIVAQLLTGESSVEERENIYVDLRDGKIDILATTLEFLEFNAQEIAKNAQIGFFVVNESNHIGDVKSGTCGSYGKLRNIVQMFGNLTALALTANAGDSVTADILESLDIKSIIVDKATRENLSLIEALNTRDKLDYICNVISADQKTIIYVNSPSSAVDLARKLRSTRHELAMSIGFYHSSLEKQEREYVEQIFRTGKIMTLISTSAFGEGIDIPDIRNVILFHMPFSETEYNLMCSCAGRDCNNSMIHLIFGEQDSEINVHQLSEITPERERLVEVYKELYALTQNEPEQRLRLSIEQLEILKDRYGQSLACGLSVFSELGFFDVKKIFVAQEPSFEIRLCQNQEKVKLTKSIRYKEGLVEHDVFQSFKSWVLKSDVKELRNRLIRPIAPSCKIQGVEVREIEE